MNNKYYVYQHVDNDGTIVYVGMGSSCRLWSTRSRSEEHKEWMISKMPSNFLYRVVKENLTQAEAYALELELLREADYKFNRYCKDKWNNPNWLTDWQKANHYRQVVNKDTGEVFESIVAAAKSVNLHPNTVRNAILKKKHQQKAAGYNWEYYDSK
jgi:excinuclease UvrABC nuclease subunit